MTLGSPEKEALSQRTGVSIESEKSLGTLGAPSRPAKAVSNRFICRIHLLRFPRARIAAAGDSLFQQFYDVSQSIRLSKVLLADPRELTERIRARGLEVCSPGVRIRSTNPASP